MINASSITDEGRVTVGAMVRLRSVLLRGDAEADDAEAAHGQRDGDHRGDQAAVVTVKSVREEPRLPRVRPGHWRAGGCRSWRPMPRAG